MCWGRSSCKPDLAQKVDLIMVMETEATASSQKALMFTGIQLWSLFVSKRCDLLRYTSPRYAETC